MSENNKGLFDGNPKMIFVFGIVLGIAVTMVFSSVNFTSNNIDGGEAVIDVNSDSGSEDNGDTQYVLAPITENDHILGDVNSAKVVMVEYSDFECPYCGRHHPNVEKLYKEYGDDLVWVYRHFPLSFHPESRPAALASECASEQGKFWEYADELFSKQSDLGDDLYMQIASDLELDTDQFKTCYESEKYADVVDTDYSSGVDAGVSGTPATYFNGQKVSGAVPYDTLVEIMDSLLQ